MANLPPPIVSKVTYSKQDNKIHCEWQPSSGQFFLIALFQGSQTIAKAPAQGFGGDLVPEKPLAGNTLYQVKVAQTDTFNGKPGPYSPPVDVIVDPLQDIKVTNKENLLDVGWTLPALGNVTAGRVSVVDKDSGTPVITATIEGSGGIIDTIGKIDPAKPYYLVVHGINGISWGPPSGEVDIIQQVPVISKVIYNLAADRQSSQLQAQSGTLLPEGMSLCLTVYASPDNRVIASHSQPSMSVTLQLDYTLDPSYIYTCRLSYQQDNSTGPQSEAVPVITVPQVIEEVEYDGQVVKVNWKNLQVHPVPVAGSIGLLQEKTPVGTGSGIGEYGEASPTKTLEGEKPYHVQLNPLLGKSRGPMADPVALIAAVQDITGVTYDGQRLTAAWSGGKGPNVTGYMLQLLSGGTVIGSAPCGSTDSGEQRGFLDVELDPQGNYQVALQAVGDKSGGQRGPAMNVVSYVPGIESVTTNRDPGTVTAVLDVPASFPPGAAGYQAMLFRGDEKVAGPTAASGSPLKVEFTYTVEAQYSYTVQVQAVGSDAGTSTGPLSAPEVLIAGVPVMESIIYDSADSQATITWGAVPDAAVTGYAVILIEKEGGAQAPVYTDATYAVVPVDPAKSHTVQVQAIGNKVVGPLSQPEAILTETVNLTKALYDGKFITAAWSAAAAANASYELELLEGTDVLETYTVSSTSATIPAALDSDGSYSLRVCIFKDTTYSAPGNGFDVISAVPAITSVTASPDKVTVLIDDTATNGKPGVVGCQAMLFRGDEKVAGPTAASGSPLKVEFDYTVEAQYSYTVQVQAVGSDAGTLAGPMSTSAAVISGVPIIVTAGYNGTDVSLTWTAVPGPGTTGYKVILSETDGTPVGNPIYTDTTSVSFAANLAINKNYQVTVQAMGNISLGSPSAPANPLAQRMGYFFPENTSNQHAYLFRGDIRQPGAADITLYLPDIFQDNQDDIPQDPFLLTKLDTPTNNFSYKITVAQNAKINVWQFKGSGIRSDLQGAYRQFMQKVAAASGTLKPGGLALVRQVIAAGLPLNFAEVLYYAYGYDTGKGYVDLVPGMRLRMDFENYQLVSPNPGDGNLNGYAGTGTSIYDIASIPQGDTNLATVFNTFLSRMTIPSVTPNRGGGGGVIDLQGTQYQLPFFRMFYPPTFPSADSGGSTSGSQNVVLIGADTLANLKNATDQFLPQHNFDALNGLSGIVYTYFRGRATPMPEIQCFINGSPCFIPLGTTVRQLVERFTSLPLYEAVSLTGFTYKRAVGNLVDDPQQIDTTYPFDRTNAVHFGFKPLNLYTYADGLDCFDLPVLGGDSLEFKL